MNVGLCPFANVVYIPNCFSDIVQIAGSSFTVQIDVDGFQAAVLRRDNARAKEVNHGRKAQKQETLRFKLHLGSGGFENGPNTGKPGLTGPGSCSRTNHIEDISEKVRMSLEAGIDGALEPLNYYPGVGPFS